MATREEDYSQWAVDRLAERVRTLEKELRDARAKQAVIQPSQLVSTSSKEKKAKVRGAFDPSKYSTRQIALKFAYLGQRYNGYEYHSNNTTPLPTIEEELWQAMIKARLIMPKDTQAVEKCRITWEGCEYSKCGRTDKGVSAFGQVISIKVRSNRPLAKRKRAPASDALKYLVELEGQNAHSTKLGVENGDCIRNAEERTWEEAPSFHPVRDEIPYAQVLNRLLPSDIRVLAWCPAPPPDFSARFSCRERQYRYFFTQPAFTPTFGESGIHLSMTSGQSIGIQRREGWLDVEAMKEAAKRYEGTHDFRNFCKLDRSKQIQEFRRRIFHSEIREVDPTSEPAAYVAVPYFAEFGGNSATAGNGAHAPAPQSRAPKVYQFILHGSAFLWHQVRHMVAILFLIGQGLEKPELVSQLLDVNETAEKPQYEMASDAPLVLWDCIFPAEGSMTREDALDWLWVGDEHGTGDKELNVTSGFRGRGKFGTGGLVDELWELWRKKKIDEVLAGSLLNLAVAQGRSNGHAAGDQTPQSQKTYLGGNSYENRGSYVPVLERMRLESVEVVNSKWLAKNGETRRGGRGDLEAQRERERSLEYMEKCAE